MGPREWEHSIGIALEPTFGLATVPTLWMPGKSTLKKSPGIRELANPVGEWDATRVTTSPTKVSGALTLEVAPGREALIIQMLTRRISGEGAYRTMNSFTVVEVIGEASHPRDMFINTGVSCNKGTFKTASGEDLIFEADTIGRERYRPSSPMVPNFTEPPAPYVFEEMLVTVQGQYEYHIETAETDFDHKLKDDSYASDATGLLRDIPSDGRIISQKLDHAYEHPELWDLAMARLPIATVLRFARANYYFQIGLPLTYATEADVADDKQSLELRPLKAAAEEAVTFTVGP